MCVSCEVRSSFTFPLLGRLDLWVCEMLRIAHFLDSRLTDGGDVSLTRRPSLYSPEILFFC
jgi:hypothetical protein